ncbi:heat-inducible transcriptional repressor HrcA [Chloroflexota bacterium]
MLTPRTGTILKSIVGQYITKAIPVPSQNIASDTGLEVSPATIRNEMAYLEHEGYIIRPHTSAGSIPSDKGYRYYVESLEKAKLSADQQCLINHLFHQVEREVEKWRSLAATLLSQLVQNVAVVSMPRPAYCQFKHMEMVFLQDSLVLLVLVLPGAKVKQKLITFEQTISQLSLTTIANRLNAEYSGLTSRQILAKTLKLSPTEQQITDYLVEMIQAEDEQESDEPCLDGLHFMLNQPEFAHGDRMRNLMELVDHRNLLKVIVPTGMSGHAVHVIIGEENKAEAIRNYSVVISQYGLPDDAIGTIGVVGPTRMPYANTIPSVGYLSSVLSELVAGLYGKEIHPD